MTNEENFDLLEALLAISRALTELMDVVQDPEGKVVVTDSVTKLNKVTQSILDRTRANIGVGGVLG